MTRGRRLLRKLTQERETGWWFTASVCTIYLAFLVWMHVHHEMWRDETHAWSVARLAQGFGELVTGDRRYDGHPPLWYWYLRVGSWVFPRIWGLQLATIVPSVTAALLLTRFAPFPRYLKVFLLSSYFLGYEYTVLSRNYVLGWLLLCVFCATYHPLRERPVISSIVLSLLALTSVYGLVLAVALASFLALDQMRISVTRLPRSLNLGIRTTTVATLAVVFSSVVFCVWFLEPVDPNPVVVPWTLAAVRTDAIPEMLNRFLVGLVPLRRFTVDFWSQHYAVWDQHPTWMPYFGGSLLVLALLCLLPSWRLVLSYVAAVVVMQVIQQARYTGMVRHWGHYFLLLLAGFWLLRLGRPRRRHLPSLLLLLLILPFQVQSFVVSVIQDTKHVFSGGRETAAFIRSHGLEDLPFVGGSDAFVLTVAGYLGRPFTAVETEEVHETVVFHSRRGGFSAPALLDRAISLARERKSPVLVVSTEPLPDPPRAVKVPLLFRSEPNTTVGEVFYVYRLEAS
jgi:hypothetical protein